MKRFSGVLIFLLLTSCSFVEITKEKQTNIHLQLGVRYLNLNKLDAARDNLLQAVNLDNQDVQAHNALAFLYEKLNQTEDARNHYQIAFKLNNNDLSVQNNYGRFLCEHNDYEQGIGLLNSASENPLNDHAWLALTNSGRCEILSGRVNNAVPYLKQALILNPNYAPALLEMQKISYEQHDFQAAQNYFQRYTQLTEANAESLLIASYTEEALNNSSVAKHYRTELLEKFPLSPQAKQMNFR